MQAVINGLTLHWNSGMVEGTVNKIKMIKRQMYGRAGFDLLRKRVTLHPALPDHKIRGRAPTSTRSAPKESAKSGSSAPRQRSPTPCTTPPGRASETYQSPSTNSYEQIART
jgi:hypothetical protein